MPKKYKVTNKQYERLIENVTIKSISDPEYLNEVSIVDTYKNLRDNLTDFKLKSSKYKNTALSNIKGDKDYMIKYYENIIKSLNKYNKRINKLFNLKKLYRGIFKGDLIGSVKLSPQNKRDNYRKALHIKGKIKRHVEDIDKTIKVLQDGIDEYKQISEYKKDDIDQFHNRLIEMVAETVKKIGEDVDYIKRDILDFYFNYNFYFKIKRSAKGSNEMLYYIVSDKYRKYDMINDDYIDVNDKQKYYIAKVVYDKDKNIYDIYASTDLDDIDYKPFNQINAENLSSSEVNNKINSDIKDIASTFLYNNTPYFLDMIYNISSDESDDIYGSISNMVKQLNNNVKNMYDNSTISKINEGVLDNIKKFIDKRNFNKGVNSIGKNINNVAKLANKTNKEFYNTVVDKIFSTFDILYKNIETNQEIINDLFNSIGDEEKFNNIKTFDQYLNDIVSISKSQKLRSDANVRSDDMDSLVKELTNDFNNVFNKYNNLENSGLDSNDVNNIRKLLNTASNTLNDYENSDTVKVNSVKNAVNAIIEVLKKEKPSFRKTETGKYLTKLSKLKSLVNKVYTKLKVRPYLNVGKSSLGKKINKLSYSPDAVFDRDDLLKLYKDGFTPAQALTRIKNAVK